MFPGIENAGIDRADRAEAHRSTATRQLRHKITQWDLYLLLHTITERLLGKWKLRQRRHFGRYSRTCWFHKSHGDVLVEVKINRSKVVEVHSTPAIPTKEAIKHIQYCFQRKRWHVQSWGAHATRQEQGGRKQLQSGC